MKKLTIAVAIIILVIAVFVAKTLYNAGQFKTLHPHGEAACLRMTGLPGPEDITIHPRTGIAFISCDDRRAARAGTPVQGAVYALDLTRKGATPKNLTAGFDKEFHPHGISLHLDGQGKAFLFVINHTRSGHFVERFEYAGAVLIHRESIAHPLMFSPNDLVAVGSRSFYVTNDHGFKPRPWRMVEDFFQLRRSYILYYDGKNMTLAAKGFGYANGIEVSADGQKIYLAATLDRAIHIFLRDAASGILTPSYTIDLGTGPDNIERDATGALYVACHPKMLDFMAHARDETQTSPSQVLKITTGGKDQTRIDELYLGDGTAISASSVAAPFNRGLLIGQVFDDHILICPEKTAR